MPVIPRLDSETLHQLLRSLPVHVLCFDRHLVCRYAAPAGQAFLGSSDSELVGRRADAVLPRGEELTRQLRTVLSTGRSRRVDCFMVETESPPAEPVAWTVLMHRCALPTGAVDTTLESPGTARAAAEVRERRPDWQRAVLVSCYESTGQAQPLVVAPLPAGGDAVSDSQELSNAPSAALFERIRTKLTVIHGFAQLLRRRQRAPAADLDAADRINQAAGELDALLEHYEAGGWHDP